MPLIKDQQQAVSSKELDQLIDRALKKIDGEKENDVCKYLPHNGGYMHHFTLRKMKSDAPTKLVQLLNKYIMKQENPKRVPHKPRKPRGSRKRPDVISLSKDELDRLLSHVRQAGDHEIAAKFSLKKSLPSIRRLLIAAVKENRVDHELWNAFVEAAGSKQEEESAKETSPSLVQVMTP